MTTVTCISNFECPKCGEEYPYFSSSDIDLSAEKEYKDKHICEKCGSEYWAWSQKFDWCPWDHYFQGCNLYTRLIDEP